MQAQKSVIYQGLNVFPTVTYLQPAIRPIQAIHVSSLPLLSYLAAVTFLFLTVRGYKMLMLTHYEC